MRYSITACTGAYRRENPSLQWVDNVDIGTNTTTGTVIPCFRQKPAREQQVCVHDAVQSALEDVFEVAAPEKQIDALVLPALGTGAANLPKAQFYQMLKERIEKQLDEGDFLPPHIYLQVWRGDRQPWQATEQGIALMLGDLVKDWNSKPHPTASSEWAPLVGISAGLALLLLFTAAFARLAVRLRYIQDLANAPIGTAVAWLVIALGLTAVIRPFTAALSDWRYYSYAEAALGFVIVVFAGALQAAVQHFNDRMTRGATALVP